MSSYIGNELTEYEKYISKVEKMISKRINTSKEEYIDGRDVLKKLNLHVYLDNSNTMK